MEKMDYNFEDLIMNFIILTKIELTKRKDYYYLLNLIKEEISNNIGAFYTGCADKVKKELDELYKLGETYEKDLKPLVEKFNDGLKNFEKFFKEYLKKLDKKINEHLFNEQAYKTLKEKEKKSKSILKKNKDEKFTPFHKNLLEVLEHNKSFIDNLFTKKKNLRLIPLCLEKEVKGEIIPDYNYKQVNKFFDKDLKKGNYNNSFWYIDHSYWLTNKDRFDKYCNFGEKEKNYREMTPYEFFCSPSYEKEIITDVKNNLLTDNKEEGLLAKIIDIKSSLEDSEEGLKKYFNDDGKPNLGKIFNISLNFLKEDGTSNNSEIEVINGVTSSDNDKEDEQTNQEEQEVKSREAGKQETNSDSKEETESTTKIKLKLLHDEKKKIDTQTLNVPFGYRKGLEDGKTFSISLNEKEMIIKNKNKNKNDSFIKYTIANGDIAKDGVYFPEKEFDFIENIKLYLVLYLEIIRERMRLINNIDLLTNGLLNEKNVNSLAYKINKIASKYDDILYYTDYDKKTYLEKFKKGIINNFLNLIKIYEGEEFSEELKNFIGNFIDYIADKRFDERDTARVIAKWKMAPITIEAISKATNDDLIEYKRELKKESTKDPLFNKRNGEYVFDLKELGEKFRKGSDINEKYFNKDEFNSKINLANSFKDKEIEKEADTIIGLVKKGVASTEENDKEEKWGCDEKDVFNYLCGFEKSSIGSKIEKNEKYIGSKRYDETTKYFEKYQYYLYHLFLTILICKECNYFDEENNTPKISNCPSELKGIFEKPYGLTQPDMNDAFTPDNQGSIIS